MEGSINNKKIPWPTRLIDLSYGSLKWGFILFIAGIPFIGAGEKWSWTAFKIIGCSGIAIFMSSFAISFILSLVALLGMFFCGYKKCGIGRALKMPVFTYVVFSLGFAITSPALMKAKNKGREIECFSNLKMFCLAYEICYADNDKRCALNNWADVLKPYCEDEHRDLFQCPMDKTGPCSYAMNENIPADAKELPADLVLLFESAPGWNQVGGADDVITDRHGKKNPGAASLLPTAMSNSSNLKISLTSAGHWTSK